MFSHYFARMRSTCRMALVAIVWTGCAQLCAQQAASPPPAAADQTGQPGLPPAVPPQTGIGGFATEPAVHHVRSPAERMEMTANSSRVITLGENIPRAQVNNREILELTALSPNEIQVFAKKPGVTQINLWNEGGQVYTIDCIVYGDARELAELLRSEFPTASVRVKPLASSVWLSGYVDRPDQVSQIISLAQDYYPTVKHNIQVVGVQQILLHVKVAEVSRTKLRNLGFDFASFNGNDFLISSVSGMIAEFTTSAASVEAAGQTVAFGIVDQNTAFFGFLDALRRYDVLKLLSDPTLVTVSGRPASFLVGGEFPILVPQSLGTVSIEYKEFGTQLDFVPIVLGNGNIRLEVRPRVSEIDNTRSITINGTTVPGLRVRTVDTGVEMRAGQTLAIAGLVQTRVEAANRGIPWLADLPYVGAAFRRVHEETNEVELLILVTPELVAAVDKCEAPKCFPGMHTDSPTDCELYLKGFIEVPSRGPCGPGGGCNPADAGPPGHGHEGQPPVQDGRQREYEALPPVSPSTAPSSTSIVPSPPEPPLGPNSASDTSAAVQRPSQRPYYETAMRERNTQPAPPTYPVRPASASSNGANRYNPPRSQDPPAPVPTAPPGGQSGLIGPVGYDVLN